MARDPGAPVRALLDVSHLGVAQRAPRRSHIRAGIYRVVEQTVRLLSAAPGVALSLCARDYVEDSLAYVAERPDMRALSFALAARTRAAMQLRHRAIERRATAAHPLAAVPIRAANWATTRVNRGLDYLTGGAIRAALDAADVFHSPVYALPPADRRVRRVRYFVTVYDLIALHHPELSWSGADAWLRNIVQSIGPEDHVLAISEYTKAEVVGVGGLDPGRVHVTPLAADPQLFYPCGDRELVRAVAARYGVPEGVPYVLSLGTLEPRKNIRHLIRTFAALVETNEVDDLHLVLVGDRGWASEAILSEAQRSPRVRDRIVFTGYADDADLAPLYSGAVAFVYPSLAEGFGLPPLEAMQCGVPVVTSNTSALPEVVGDAGILADPLDGDALAQALRDVYRDSALRAALSRRALQRARQFTWERFADGTVAAYRAAL